MQFGPPHPNADLQVWLQNVPMTRLSPFAVILPIKTIVPPTIRQADDNLEERSDRNSAAQPENETVTFRHGNETMFSRRLSEEENRYKEDYDRAVRRQPTFIAGNKVL